MKAMVIDTFGGVEKLHFQDIPTPIPQDHEILIRIEYTSVNPVDWKIREGMLKSRLPHQFPLILGWDAAGVIVGLGKDVKNFHTGDEVYAYCRKPIIQAGTYAEYVTVDTTHVALKPKNISFAQAASIPLAALTAWQTLFDFTHIQAQQTILIHGGAGGVGSFAIQFAKYAQASEVWTTCSSTNRDYVQQLGADHIIDYTKEDFVSIIHKKQQEGLDIIFDTIGKKTLQDSFAIVKPKGVLVSITEPLSPEDGKNQIRTGFVFVKPNGRQLHQIGNLIEKEIIQLPHIIEMDLEQAAYAQTQSQKGHTKGKIVLKVR